MKNETAYDLLEALDWLVVLEVARIGDQSWSPFSLVFGVVDHRSVPLAPVVRVGLHWFLPLAAPGGLNTLGVRNGRSDPVTIFFIVPLLRLLRFGIRDNLKFVVEPALRLDGVLIDDLVRGVVIPVIGLGEESD